MPKSSYNLSDITPTTDTSGSVVSDKLDTLINSISDLSEKKETKNDDSSLLKQLNTKLEELVRGKANSTNDGKQDPEGSNGLFKSVEKLFDNFFKDLREKLSPQEAISVSQKSPILPELPESLEANDSPEYFETVEPTPYVAEQAETPITQEQNPLLYDKVTENNAQDQNNTLIDLKKQEETNTNEDASAFFTKLEKMFDDLVTNIKEKLASDSKQYLSTPESESSKSSFESPSTEEQTNLPSISSFEKEVDEESKIPEFRVNKSENREEEPLKQFNTQPTEKAATEGRGSDVFFNSLERMFNDFFKSIQDKIAPDTEKEQPGSSAINLEKEFGVHQENPIPVEKDSKDVEDIKQLEHQKVTTEKIEEDDLEDSLIPKQQEQAEENKTEKQSTGLEDSLTDLFKSGKSSSSMTGEAGEAAAGGFEIADLLPLLALNTGGTTNATEFYVGEGPGGLDNPNPETIEKVENPTGAPIRVLNSEQMGLDGSPGFSKGTINQNLPGYASGTQAGQVGATISSGGEFSNPNQVIGGISQGAATAASYIPIVGDEIADIIVSLEYLVQSIADVIEGFNKLAEHIGKFSGDIKMAEAEVKVANIQKDIETAEDIGPQLASLYKDSNMIWIDIQKILRTISEPFLDVLVPLMRGFREFMDQATPWIRGFIDSFSILFAVIAEFASFNLLDLDDYITRKAEEIKRHFVKPDKTPFVRDLAFGAVAAVLRNRPNIRVPGI